MGSFAGSWGADEEQTLFHGVDGTSTGVFGYVIASNSLRWRNEFVQLLLSNHAFVALGDHVGLHLLRGVDGNADQDQQ